jgi:cell division protein FtsA
MYSTGVGLLMYGLRQQELGAKSNSRQEESESLISRIKNWFTGNF